METLDSDDAHLESVLYAPPRSLALQAVTFIRSQNVIIIDVGQKDYNTST